jgi:hypothetical protein
VSLNDDLAQLEQSIRILQIEWGKFFGRVEKQPPNKLKAQVEALIRKYAVGQIQNPTDRFRYQTLSARYASFSEMWSRRLRALEEGRPIQGVRPPRTLTGPPAAAAEPARKPAAARVAEPVRVGTQAGGEAAVRTLFERFVEARKASGEVAPVKYESFEKLINQQAARLRDNKGAQAVDFRLETKDGKVSLKAKPVR